MMVPEGETGFKDLVFGEISTNNQMIDDKVLIKKDGQPSYHFACVIDDYLMNITHVIRGKEWLERTPEQILLYEMMGMKEEMPLFAHLPEITALNGEVIPKKLKGKTIEAYREEGYLPAGLVNAVGLLGWAPPAHDNPSNFDLTPREFVRKEVYSLEDMEAYLII